MKITILTGPFGCLPPYGIGAIEKRWFNMAVAMTKHGHSVTFCCKTASKAYEEFKGLSYTPIKGYKRTGRLIFDLFLDLIYTSKALFKLKKCDVLVLNTFWSPFLCSLFRSKYAVSVYNVARYPKGQFKYMKTVDRLACVSSAVGRAVIAQAPSMKTRVKVINNPVDVTSFPFTMKTNTTEKYRICYTGRVHREKGLDILVKSYCWLKHKGHHISLSIIGARDTAQGGSGQEYIEELKRLANGYPIEWIDPIANAAELAQKIAESDIYCYPSVAERGETFGVAPLEAMAVGRPAIVSALNCFGDFVEDGVTGIIFDHRDEDAHLRLSEKIEYLIQHPDIRERLAMNGSRIAHEKFNTERIAQEYLEDFIDLLKAKPHA